MQKTITPLNKTDLLKPNLQVTKKDNLEPSNYAIRKILQFAANYRVQKIGENQYLEMNLSK